MRRIILALMLSLLPAAALAQNDSFLSSNGTFKSPFSVSNTWTAPQTFIGGAALSFVNPTLVTSVGAKCDGVTDDTAAFAAGVTSLPRGGVLRVPDGVQCIVAGQVSIATDGIYIVGGGISGRDTAGSVITCSTAAAVSCITWSGGTAGGLVNLRIDASTRTGAACTVSVSGTSHLLFQNLYTLDNNSFCLTSTNTIIFDNVTSIGPTSGSGKAWINWIGTLAARSDVLIVQNSGYQANSGGADCILWDGLAHTMTLTSVRCLNAHYGMHTTNVNGNNSNYPSFLQAYDFEVDGGTNAAIRIDAGGYYRCIHCDLFHSTNDVGVIINGDTGGTITRSVTFIGGRIGNSGMQCVTSGAQGVRFVDVNFGSCSLNGAGLFPGVEFTGTALNSQVIGGSMVDFGDGNNASPGVQLDAGASFIQIDGIDLHYPAVPIVDNSGASNNFFRVFATSGSQLGLGKRPGTGQVLYGFQSNPGAQTTVRVENPNSSTSSAARFEMATGSPSAFSDLSLIDGTTPTLSITTGSGVTGGITLDGSQATGAQVQLKAASGQVVNIASSFFAMTSVALGSLPSCVSGTAGWRATINNGIAAPTFLQAVGVTTGTSVQPVLCNGSAWVYG